MTLIVNLTPTLAISLSQLSRLQLGRTFHVEKMFAKQPVEDYVDGAVKQGCRPW